MHEYVFIEVLFLLGFFWLSKLYLIYVILRFVSDFNCKGAGGSVEERNWLLLSCIKYLSLYHNPTKNPHSNKQASNTKQNNNNSPPQTGHVDLTAQLPVIDDDSSAEKLEFENNLNKKGNADIQKSL